MRSHAAHKAMLANSFYFFEGNELFHDCIIAESVFHKTLCVFITVEQHCGKVFFKANLAFFICGEMNTFLSLDTTYPHYYTGSSYGSN